MSTTTAREIDEGAPARAGGLARVRGVLPREGGSVTREEGRTRVERVLEDLTDDVSVEVFKRGVRLYNEGRVHETAYPWVFRVGSRNGGLYGYEVDLSVGKCGCKAYQMREYVCKHVIAAGMAWVAREGA